MNATGLWVMIEPHNELDRAKQELKARSGLELDIKNQGAPNMGWVRHIGTEVPDEREFEVGDYVIFDEPRPNGFKHEGVGLIPVKWDKIIARIQDESKKIS